MPLTCCSLGMPEWDPRHLTPSGDRRARPDRRRAGASHVQGPERKSVRGC